MTPMVFLRLRDLRSVRHPSLGAYPWITALFVKWDLVVSLKGMQFAKPLGTVLNVSNNIPRTWEGVTRTNNKFIYGP
jgi:hypothetical protein